MTSARLMPTSDIDFHFLAKSHMSRSKTYVLAFRDHGREPADALRHPRIQASLIIAADDEEHGAKALSPADARLAASFVRNVACVDTYDDIDLIVTCPGGIGRSAGAYAAILCASGQVNDAERAVFSNPRMCPNRRVFDMLYELLFDEESGIEAVDADALFEKNRKAFEAAQEDE